MDTPTPKRPLVDILRAQSYNAPVTACFRCAASGRKRYVFKFFADPAFEAYGAENKIIAVCDAHFDEFVNEIAQALERVMGK